MRRTWMRIGLFGACSLCGCIDPGGFTCDDNSQCVLEPQGECHPTGVCTYPNGDCGSGFEWSRNAGALAGMCVDGESPTTGGPASASASSLTGLTTSDPAESSDGSSAPQTTESGPAGVCGDDEMDAGEECDDGNLDDGDGCNADCRPSGRPLWTATVAASEFDNTFHAVALADDGTIVSAGYSSKEQADDAFDSNAYDELVALHDPAGAELLVVSEPHGGRDELRCAFVDGDGEIWVGGERFSAIGAELYLGRLMNDALVTELGYSSVDMRETVAHGCAATEDGQIVVAGMLDDEQAAGYEGWDRLILSDALGRGGFTLHLPGVVDLRDVAFAIEPLPGGAVAVVGNTTLTLEDVSDRWVAVFESSGTERWSFEDGGPGGGQEEVFAVLAVDSTLYAAGATLANKGNVSRGWLAAFDVQSGAILNEDDLGLPPPTAITGMAATATGDLILSGFTGEPDSDGFVARFDPPGDQVRWLRTDLEFARADAVAVRDDGTIAVVGSTVMRGDNGPARVSVLAP